MSLETTSNTTVPSSPSSPTSSGTLTDIVFLADDVLFKVPRRPFEHESEVFSAMFELPSGNSSYSAEGSSDDNPIRLEGVSEDEFRSLLWVMFRSGYFSSHALTQPQWVSVLRLATMWFLKDIRERAIAQLSKLVALPTACIALQEQPLTSQDLESLGWDTAAKLFQVLESVVFSGPCGCGCNHCTVAHEHIATPGPAEAHGHGNRNVGQVPVGSRTEQVTVSTLRKQTDFLGTALY
ncbi:hypothetical protein V8D89_012126 [Ganoderma adspersum]